MKKIVILGLLGLLSCDYNPCKNSDGTTPIYVEIENYPSLPKKADLYVYAQDGNFVELEATENIREYRVDTLLNCARLSFAHRFFKYKDYRIVVDDTVVFDIDRLTFDKYVDSAHWAMSGPNKKCAIASVRVNGISVEKKYLEGRAYFFFPYDMCKTEPKSE